MLVSQFRSSLLEHTPFLFSNCLNVLIPKLPPFWMGELQAGFVTSRKKPPPQKTGRLFLKLSANFSHLLPLPSHSAPKAPFLLTQPLTPLHLILVHPLISSFSSLAALYTVYSCHHLTFISSLLQLHPHTLYANLGYLINKLLPEAALWLLSNNIFTFPFVDAFPCMFFSRVVETVLISLGHSRLL